MIPQVLYTLWTGNNATFDRRMKAFDTLRQTACVEPVLVDPENLVDRVATGDAS